MSKQIKVGVVGCGYWGPNLIRNFRSLPDCNLKVMCDISKDRLKHLTALYPEVKGETSFEHILNGVGLDAVVVATSVKLHYPMAKAALLAGKHVMIEKPMASSSEQCAELVSIARANGLVLMGGPMGVYEADRFPFLKQEIQLIKAALNADVPVLGYERDDKRTREG